MEHEFSGDTLPVWIDTVNKIHFPTLPPELVMAPQGSADSQSMLKDSLTVDVCIIGGGMTGITAANLLKKAGKTVAVVDLGKIGHGETGHTTAHLTEVLDIGYRELISHFGLEGASLATHSCRKAIQRIEANIKEYGIACGFSRLSGYKYTENAEDVDKLEDEAEAATKLNVPHELLHQTPLPFSVKRALRFPNQGQFHPLQYLQPLSQTIPGDGSYVFEQTRVLDVEEGEPCKVHTDRGQILAREVIVSANVPVLNKFFLHTKIAAYRTYALALEIKNEWQDYSLFWDTESPYHYIRSAYVKGTPLVIVGGEDHKTGKVQHTENSFAKLEEYCRKKFDVSAIHYRWSGQIIEPIDGLPFIGRNALSEHVYVATGYSGTGMTFGTVAGMLLADLINGVANPWADLFSATRVKPFAGAKNFISENVDFPSHLIGDRFSGVDKTDHRVRENEGRIVKIEGKKVAAYRDAEGKMHYMSPVCPHLGCYVGWNDAERSWDCPCHGSRFSPLGEVLNGPAVTDLANLDYQGDLPMAPVTYENQSQATDPLGAPLLSFFSCPLKTP